MLKNRINTIEDLCNAISELIGPCKKCGNYKAVLAVYENNESDEIIGYKLVCPCDVGGKSTISQDELKNLPLYSIEDLSKMIK